MTRIVEEFRFRLRHAKNGDIWSVEVRSLANYKWQKVFGGGLDKVECIEFLRRRYDTRWYLIDKMHGFIRL